MQVEVVLSSVSTDASDDCLREDCLRGPIERSFSIFENDADEWGKSNAFRRTMMMKASLLAKTGHHGTFVKSLTKETIEAMSSYHLSESRKLEEQELEAQREIVDSALSIDQCYNETEEDFSLNITERTEVIARQNYINRLVGMRAMKLKPSKKSQTIIIFDWDDTLLCTSFLLALGAIDTTSDAMLPLKPLDEAASQLLLKAAGSGEVYLVTNAEEGWVQYSGKFFLPKTLDVILNKNIHIISARTRYQHKYPTENYKWKIEACMDIKKKYELDVMTNFICLGDSNIEMDAAQLMAKHFSHIMVKTVKFKESPQPDELLKQVELVIQKYDTIFTKLGNLTVKLEKKPRSSK